MRRHHAAPGYEARSEDIDGDVHDFEVSMLRA
jgi:hypothetical protein